MEFFDVAGARVYRCAHRGHLVFRNLVTGEVLQEDDICWTPGEPS